MIRGREADHARCVVDAMICLTDKIRLGNQKGNLPMNDVTPAANALLTEDDRRLIGQLSNTKGNITGCIVLFLIACYVWLRYIHLFAQAPFFALYNILAWAGLVAAPLVSVHYQRRINTLIAKLTGEVQQNTDRMRK